MYDLLELCVRVGAGLELPMVSYAYHNIEDEDTAPRYESLREALQDGWQVVSVLPTYEIDLTHVYQTFWLQRSRD